LGGGLWIQGAVFKILNRSTQRPQRSFSPDLSGSLLISPVQKLNFLSATSKAKIGDTIDPLANPMAAPEFRI
jgi:hypothetical protein